MRHLRLAAGLALLIIGPAAGPQSAPAKDPLASLAFLQGIWEAKSGEASGVSASGKYSFSLELKNHVMARHTVSLDACKAPDSYDCEHGDLLYVYPEADGSLHAIYFDNEGHVIQYAVSTPTPTTAEFLSDRSKPGPQFRLLYERKAQTMSGKFQMRMPGQTDWHSYLEWSGDKK
jgi:hypothetical protein